MLVDFVFIVYCEQLFISLLYFTVLLLLLQRYVLFICITIIYSFINLFKLLQFCSEILVSSRHAWYMILVN
jgi:hypothetical protein